MVEQREGFFFGEMFIHNHLSWKRVKKMRREGDWNFSVRIAMAGALTMIVFCLHRIDRRERNRNFGVRIDVIDFFS